MQAQAKIQMIVVRSHDSSYGGYPYVCEVIVQCDAKEWNKLKKANDLGSLYGVDISNEVYRITDELVPAWSPSVCDRDRAKAGVKTIRLSYYFRDHNAAEKLGLEVKRMKNGECFASFGACEVIYDSRDKRVLQCVR